MLNTNPDQPKRVLILTSTSTGNNIFCSPAIRLIRKHRPEWFIGVAALKPLSAEVFEYNPDINRLYVVQSAKAFERIADAYDHIVCLNSNALKKLKHPKTPVSVISDQGGKMARADQILAFVAGLLKVNVESSDRNYVIGVPSRHSVLDSAAKTPGEALVHIHLGSGTPALHGWKFFNRGRAVDDDRLWPVERYIEMFRLILGNVPQCRIVLTGTQNEAFIARKFMQNIPGAINLVGKTTAMDIFGMMRDVDVFIAHDCGIMHIAAASETPIIGLYAPTDPIVYGPYPPRPQHVIFKRDKITAIRPEEVADAACRLLQARREAAR